MKAMFEKTLWTVWRPVVLGSKSDDPAYRRPVYVGALKIAERNERLTKYKLNSLGLVTREAKSLILPRRK